MNPDNKHFDKKEEYNDGKYSMYSFSGNNGKFRRLACSEESICVLPFDLNERGQIKNIYLAKYMDHLLGGVGFTCITDTFNKDQFDSYYNAVESCLADEMGLNDIHVNDTYLLGTVRHGVPFSKEYKCYGVNLTNHMEDPSGYTPIGLNPNQNIRSIEKVRFTRLLNGDIQDSLALSCSLLLISYFSD